MRSFVIFLSIFICQSLNGQEIGNQDTLSNQEINKAIRDCNWYINRKASIGVFIVDYETYKPKRYYHNLYSCRENLGLLAPDSLEKKLVTYLMSIWPYWPRNQRLGSSQLQLQFKNKLSFQDFDRFILFNLQANFGGRFLYDKCSGLLVFAGSVIHNGKGRQFFPAESLPIDNLKKLETIRKHPISIKVIGLFGDTTFEDGIKAYKESENYNFIQAWADYDFNVLVLLYPKTIGFFDPNNAEWIFIIYTSS